MLLKGYPYVFATFNRYDPNTKPVPFQGFAYSVVTCISTFPSPNNCKVVVKFVVFPGGMVNGDPLRDMLMRWKIPPLIFVVQTTLLAVAYPMFSTLR